MSFIALKKGIQCFFIKGMNYVESSMPKEWFCKENVPTFWVVLKNTLLRRDSSSVGLFFSSCGTMCGNALHVRKGCPGSFFYPA